MSSIQILSVVAVVIAVIATYVPFSAIRLPSAKKPTVLQQIEAVVAVREAHTEPAVLTACNALLQALLEVKA